MTETRKIVRVGFDQQQIRLIERLKEGAFAEKSDAEIVRHGFARWLEGEGWLSVSKPQGQR
jgi:hypothetical protein